MIRKPLMNYKTEENKKKLVFEENEIQYFNHYKDKRYHDGRPIGLVTKTCGNIHRVEVNGNKGFVIERIGDYDYVVNGNLVTQCVGCSFEYLEFLTRDNVQYDDYQRKFEIREEIINMQIANEANVD